MNEKTEELRKLKVFFKTASPAHNFYRHQFLNPPKNVEYVPSTPTLLPQSKGINPMVMPVKHGLLKKVAIKTLKQIDVFEITNTPFFMPLTVPNDIDLIHSAQYLLRTNKPYVVDFEEVSVFAGYKPYIYTERCKRLVAKMLSGDNVRKIIPWTEAAMKGMFNLLKDQPQLEKLKEKTEVVYPTISPQPHFKKHDHDTINLLFIGRQFDVKGAMETVKAFAMLKKDYSNLRLRIISNIPESVRKEFGRLEGLELIQTGKDLPDNYIEASYRWADVFTYPVHLDTLGFVIMEAMSYGLPVISVDHFAVPELVKDGVNGKIIHAPYSDHRDFIKYFAKPGEKTIEEITMEPPHDYIERFRDAIEEVIRNPKDIERMGKSSREIIERGHLSAEHRSKELRRVYDESLE